MAIQRTKGFTFAQLRETYILGAQEAFEQGREVTIAHVIEGTELQITGAHELKRSRTATGFVRNPERSGRR